MKGTATISIDTEVWALARAQIGNISGWIEAALRQRLGIEQTVNDEETIQAELSLVNAKKAGLELSLKELKDKKAKEEAKWHEVTSEP